MKIGIDGSNVRSGGAVTHLTGILREADPAIHGFEQITLWSSAQTLARVPDRAWLTKVEENPLNRSLAHRTWWQIARLSRLAHDAKCDLLFVPGGSYAGSFRPFVTMSRNLLPFESSELRRYGMSRRGLKFLALRRVQARTFRNADGLIFLTEHARRVVMPSLGGAATMTTLIPHGVDASYSNSPRPQKPITAYSETNPFRIVYVSIVDLYKHQWHVADAVSRLKRQGFPVQLDLVGPAYGPALKKLNDTIERLDPEHQFIRYSGSLPHSEMYDRYSEEDVCVFASSCENMPNILLEGMASGLPIACSDRGPMREVLGDAGLYFNPENPADIADNLIKLVSSPELRTQLAARSFERVKSYSWKRCADETFAFLSQVRSAYTA